MKLYKFTLIALLTITIISCGDSRLPKVSCELNGASVSTNSGKLILTTGVAERELILTDFGFSTQSLKLKSSDNNWAAENAVSDWAIGTEKAVLRSLTAEVSDDEKFTDQHIAVVAEFEYPDQKVIAKYITWVYPNAEGFRTQMQLKAVATDSIDQAWFDNMKTEGVNLSFAPKSTTAFGYMQGIKTSMDRDILTEKEIAINGKLSVDWASGILLSNRGESLILVKESNKSTSLQEKGDVATGDFVFDSSYLTVTGAGMKATDLLTDRFRECWANWVILSGGDSTIAQQLSLKRFDRGRFPVNPNRDMFMMANTWGTEDMRPECLYAAREENVLEEIESVADLGIDLLQIDDGWQAKGWDIADISKNHEHKDVIGDYDIYPEGWVNVKAKAEKYNIKLGLWAAWVIPTDKLIEHYDRGNFKGFKLDFANLKDYSKREMLMGKARELIKHSNYTAAVNWDVTEIAPRAGYFYGREYGNIYLENRKTTTVRANVQYVPFKVLRDAWLLSKYVNLNKFQITVQNIDMTKPSPNTDALEYNHPYVVGLTLMGSPIFFQETRYYDDKARAQIKPLLKVYKENREAMYAGYVFPIGDVPNNSNWTGFQNYNPETKVGYLTIFRELHNQEGSHKFNLNSVGDSSIKLTDLLSGESKVIKLKGGVIDIDIDTPAGFRYYKYELI